LLLSVHTIVGTLGIRRRFEFSLQTLGQRTDCRKTEEIDYRNSDTELLVEHALDGNQSQRRTADIEEVIV
jgi:hypothetical protein